MTVTTSAAASSTPAGTLLFLALLGAATLFVGARWALDLGGAVGKTLARRRAALELRGQRTGDLGFADTRSLGPWFFRVMGSVIAAGGLLLLALSLILAFG